MKHIQFAGKFLCFIVVFGLCVAGVAGFSASRMWQVDQGYRLASATFGEAALSVLRANRFLQQARASIEELLISTTEQANAAALTNITDERTGFDQTMQAAIMADPEQHGVIDQFRLQGLDLIDRVCKPAIDLGAAATEASEILRSQEEFLRECRPQLIALGKQMVNLTEAVKLRYAEYHRGLSQTTAATLVTMAALVTGLIALMSAAGVAVARSWVVQPVRSLLQTMGRLTTGDLDADVPGVDRRDELGGMARAVQVFKEVGLANRLLEAEAARLRDAGQAAAVASLRTGLAHLARRDLAYRLDDTLTAEYERLRTDFNEAAGTLQGVIRTVAADAASISGGMAEIMQAADDLSRRTEHQAATLEQTAAALDQITSTVLASAAAAAKAKTAMSRARSDAERSSGVMDGAVQAMSQIQDSARQITQIIGVIDKIASQTNMLALNASVEAARASDAGRGFAVVATEIKTLAHRSAMAASEIRALINASGEHVQRGVIMVGATGETLRGIATQIADVDDAVTSIAASAHQQSTALHQVNTAVNQMDQMTQQNAAMVEQTTAASHALGEQTNALVSLTRQFRLDSAKAA